MQFPAVQVIYRAPGAGPGGEDRRYLDAHRGAEAQDAEVEQLVVQDAQGQAVVEVIRAAEGEPDKR
jgi:hypothetical protein